MKDWPDAGMRFDSCFFLDIKRVFWFLNSTTLLLYKLRNGQLLFKKHVDCGIANFFVSFFCLFSKSCQTQT
jgi:hypothetical protein